MESNTLQSGTTLQGKAYTYTIRKVLGQGTFGITYLATTKVKVAGALGSLETTMQVAIKEFFMRDINGREENTVTTGSQGGVYANYKKKFAREAENLSKLDHPHIVKVLEYFEANNTVYYAMEYVEGGNLDAYITQHNGLPEAECVKYARQIGSALSYMHAHKMLHLDLKPGNIMLRPNKDAVLIDFGLSKQYNENGEPESSTSVGSGTPGYAPLEQANYHEGKDFPVTMDVYALGATMFKMLTGVRPPEASVILNDGFPAYELQKHHVGDALTACVGKAMAALRKDRPQSVEEFLKELQGNGAKTDNEEGTDYETTSDKKNVTEKDQKSPHKSGKKSQNILIGGLNAFLGCLVVLGFIITLNNNSTTHISSGQLIADTVPVIESVEAIEENPTERLKPGYYLVNNYIVADLGLSVYWSTCNIGAKKPWETGNFYARGEVEIKDSYSKDNYTLWNEDHDYISGTKWDVAKQKIGDKWRIPTEDEFMELKDKCKWEWDSNNGVWGYSITGPNGNSIFLPAAGYKAYNNIHCKGEKGYYWLGSITGFNFDASEIHVGGGSSSLRYDGYVFFGHLIRPVYNP